MKERFREFALRRQKRQLVMAVAFVAVMAGGWFFPLLGYFIPACMVLGMGVSFSRGRKWCDWYCPRGSAIDVLLKKISPGKEIPGFIRGWPVRTAILSFLMIFLAYQIMVRWPDFYSLGRFFVILLTVTTGVGVLLALFIHQRTWCYLCPIGTMQNWVGGKKYPLSIDSGACTECTLCSRVCPVGISPLSSKGEKSEIVKARDCLKCASCVAACPKGALSFAGAGSAPLQPKDRRAA